MMSNDSKVVLEALKNVVKTITDRFKIVHVTYSKPEQIKEINLLSAFTEVEFKVNGFEALLAAIIDFGPTVVEILEPKQITVDRSELQSSFADLIRKIHDMSTLIQNFGIENMQLKKMLEKDKQ